MRPPPFSGEAVDRQRVICFPLLIGVESLLLTGGTLRVRSARDAVIGLIHFVSNC